jgi:molybdopterin molybdotransferase
MLEVAAARERILDGLEPLKAEVTALTSSALGQVLALDVTADIDSPPFSKSMMDGYAVRAADCAAPNSMLKSLQAIAAGQESDASLESGQCVRIFTGAPIPNGADAVVKQEQCQALVTGEVVIQTVVKPGQNILPIGAEYKRGDVVIPRGTLINPQAFGLFAAAGKTAVPTIPLPKVGVLVTGNELVEANMKPMGAQIRNSNGPMLVAQAVRAGSLPRYLGIARDEKLVLSSLIKEGLATSQVLVLAGGVSVGDHDLVPQVLRELGVEILFHTVRMKPGKPLLFGRKGAVLVFGLPGNPVSSFVGFELFVRPTIAKLAGRIPHEVKKTMPLSEAFQTSNDRPTFFPAKRVGDAVQALPWFGSADLRNLLSSDLLIELPIGEINYPAGHPVTVREI